jgi:hypothetical protein
MNRNFRINRRKSLTMFVIIPLLIVVAALFGWGSCIYKATQCDYKTPYKAEAFYLIGSFVPPIGAIVGYIPMDNLDKKSEE